MVLVGDKLVCDGDLGITATNRKGREVVFLSKRGVEVLFARVEERRMTGQRANPNKARGLTQRI